MRKLPLILLCILSAALIAAMPFLCTHSDIRPEVSTAYYDHKAKEDALTATGPEAELMRMLTGLTADTKLESVKTPIRFSWFGMTLAIGTVAAITLLFLLGRKLPRLHAALCWTAALAVPFGLICARLVYCLVNINYYLNAISAPEAMLNIWEGGLSLCGALAGVVLAGVIGAKLTRTPIGATLYACFPALYSLAGIAAVACMVAKVGFGPELPVSFFTIEIGGVPRLFTAWLRIIIPSAVMLIVAPHVKKSALPAGHRFAVYAFLYGSVMILLESLRRDGHMVWGFVHAEMVFDLCIMLPALLYLARTKKRILLSLLATAVLAGAVVALEFALDRSNIGDGLLYAVYAALLGGYVFMGCWFALKRAE